MVLAFCFCPTWRIGCNLWRYCRYCEHSSLNCLKQMITRSDWIMEAMHTPKRLDYDYQIMACQFFFGGGGKGILKIIICPLDILYYCVCSLPLSFCSTWRIGCNLWRYCRYHTKVDMIMKFQYPSLELWKLLS